MIDVNVLVYAHNEADEFHARSVRWFEETFADGELIGIPWHCFMAFLRVSTSRRGMLEPISIAEASTVIDRWVGHPQVVIPEPGRRFWKILRELGADSDTSGRGWSDAYLAALALENGARFATFDRDFRKFKGLRLVEL